MNSLQEFINFLVTSDKEFELVDALLRRKEIHFIFNENDNLLTWKVR